MIFDNLLDKLKRNWFSFIVAGIVFAAEQVIGVIWVVYYLNLDIRSGNTEQMAIQIFTWMNSDVNIFSRLFKLTQDIGNLAIPFVVIGVLLYFLERQRCANQNQ